MVWKEMNSWSWNKSTIQELLCELGNFFKVCSPFSLSTCLPLLSVCFLSLSQSLTDTPYSLLFIFYLISLVSMLHFFPHPPTPSTSNLIQMPNLNYVYQSSLSGSEGEMRQSTFCLSSMHVPGSVFKDGSCKKRIKCIYVCVFISIGLWKCYSVIFKLLNPFVHGRCKKSTTKKHNYIFLWFACRVFVRHSPFPSVIYFCSQSDVTLPMT